jgi:hypothetical protein
VPERGDVVRSCALLFIAAATLTVSACEPREQDTATTDAPTVTPLPETQQTFWDNLRSLCGQAFEGRVIDPEPADTAFAGHRLVMHVRECADTVTYVPFHVGDDRSRTWWFIRTADGLRLKHDHRHEDGSEDEVTWYGGDARDAGTATRQEFPADQHTADLIPYAATNVWTVELVPGDRYVYMLRREGRRFDAHFDLTHPVDPPPAPWGWE